MGNPFWHNLGHLHSPTIDSTHATHEAFDTHNPFQTLPSAAANNDQTLHDYIYRHLHTTIWLACCERVALLVAVEDCWNQSRCIYGS